MASNLTKLARITAVVGAVGAISLVGLRYASQSTDIQSIIDSLKAKALDWKNQAGLNKAELNKKTEEYNTLKANYDAVLEILGIDGAQDIEVIKQKVQDIYNNANATGIEGTNNTLKAIANALGVELTDADKNANGVYKTDKIIEELGKLDDELDKLDEALGDLAINLESGDMEYRENMTLTEKINYLIGQINKANDDQTKLKTYADEADEAVDEASADYVVEENKGNEGESESAKDPEQPTNPPASETSAKDKAYKKLTGTAKTLADNGYQKGDLLVDAFGDYHLKVTANCVNATTALGIGADISGEVPNKYYSGILNITAQQVADLNAWAEL